MSECQSKEEDTEVSRSHSSEEAFVMRVERRAESLEQGRFFRSSKSQQLKRQREKEVLGSRIIPMEKREQSNHLFMEEIPVWYNQSGEVNPEWLSACQEERSLTSTS